MKSRAKSELYVEVLDTTLRDGEQTPGVAFTPQEKLDIARLLLRLHLDRLEIGSARVSQGEADALKQIVNWAERHDELNKLEILGFIDNGRSIDWVKNLGGQVINLLAKGSEPHCRIQLRKTPQRHLDDIKREIDLATAAGLRVNLYLEDWSNGMKQNFGYVYEMVNSLKEYPIEHFMLADTLGVLNYVEVERYCDWMRHTFPEQKFDFHGHNDYGLVTANSLAAIRAGIDGIHTTVNGLGERAGNQTLAQLVVTINDMTDRKTHVNEKELQHASEIIQSFSGKRCSWNAPIVGSDVYTQTCGVHADGDKKGNLYMNRLLPERFGRRRDYALGKLSGKASIDRTLEDLGLPIELDAELRQKVLDEVIRLGDKKKTVTPSDLPFIISGAMHTDLNNRLKIVDFEVTSRRNNTPKARIVLEFDGACRELTASGDGGYDALVKAVRKGLKLFGLTMPKLSDYQVRIPPGGRTDALVETTITWKSKSGTFITTGIDSDQLVAAVIATEKMLNLEINRQEL